VSNVTRLCKGKHFYVDSQPFGVSYRAYTCKDEKACTAAAKLIRMVWAKAREENPRLAKKCPVTRASQHPRLASGLRGGTERSITALIPGVLTSGADGPKGQISMLVKGGYNLTFELDDDDDPRKAERNAFDAIKDQLISPLCLDDANDVQLRWLKDEGEPLRRFFSREDMKKALDDDAPVGLRLLIDPEFYVHASVIGSDGKVLAEGEVVLTVEPTFGYVLGLTLRKNILQQLRA